MRERDILAADIYLSWMATIANGTVSKEFLESVVVAHNGMQRAFAYSVAMEAYASADEFLAVMEQKNQ